MIDHFSIGVKNLQVSKAFYQKTLEPLGYELRFDNEYAVSFGEPRGSDPAGDFWLESGQEKPHHFAFSAKTRKEVEDFYHSGLAAGGKDNGAPGERNHYHEGYYAAFIIDPDGNNIEAVCHQEEYN